jgi:hypothetical protein
LTGCSALVHRPTPAKKGAPFSLEGKLTTCSWPLADGVRIGKCKHCNGVHLMLYDEEDNPIAEWVIGDVEDFIAGLRNPEDIEE